MDNFREEVVTRKQGKIFNTVGYILCWILMIIFGIAAFLGITELMAMNFQLGNILLTVIGGLLLYAMYRYKDNFRIEYEYTFTNGELDIAMVLGNNRRKALTSVRMREVEAGGWEDGPTFARFDEMKEVKHHNFYINSKSHLYYLFFTRDGKRIMILLEPTETLVDMMTQYSKVMEK